MFLRKKPRYSGTCAWAELDGKCVRKDVVVLVLVARERKATDVGGKEDMNVEIVRILEVA